MNDYDKISNVFLYRVFHISHVTPREKSDLRGMNVSVEFTFFHDVPTFRTVYIIQFNMLVFLSIIPTINRVITRAGDRVSSRMDCPCNLHNGGQCCQVGGTSRD